jgi:tRNA pseudouridine55 synthase
MATGVLVLAIGEARKLVPFLTASDKAYEARIALGVATDTLDAEGEVVARAPVPEVTASAVEQAAASFVGRIAQRAPVVSALRVAGVRLHRAARRGMEVEAPVREVVCHGLTVTGIGPNHVDLAVACGKGFYVRSLARDLAEALGTVGHLSRLRRTRSGELDLRDAVSGEVLRRAREGDPAARAASRAALRSVRDGWADRPTARLTELGRRDARHGRPITDDGLEQSITSFDDGLVVGLISPDDRLVALARRDGAVLRVQRGLWGEEEAACDRAS